MNLTRKDILLLIHKARVEEAKHAVGIANRKKTKNSLTTKERLINRYKYLVLTNKHK